MIIPINKHISSLSIPLNWIILIVVEGMLFEKYNLTHSFILLSIFIIPIFIKYILTYFSTDKKKHLNWIYITSGGLMLLFGLSAYLNPTIYKHIYHFETLLFYCNRPVSVINLLQIMFVNLLWYILYLIFKLFIKNEDLSFIASCIFITLTLILLFKFDAWNIIKINSL
jgi:hypothetical protein